METLRGLLGLPSPPQQRPIVETDLVYPLHQFDNAPGMRSLVMGWSVRFNDVLDPEKLHLSLSKLLEIGDWKKLGGRLRLNAAGRLELHVPQPFTDERPAVTYTHQSYQVSIDEHPLGKRLPRPTDGPSILDESPEFRPFVARQNHPTTLQEYLQQDISILALHITSFTDATLVAISWHHSLMDVMGVKATMEAWSLVLAGREAQVPPVLGASEDVLDVALRESQVPREEFALQSRTLTGLSWGFFVFRFLWDMFWMGKVTNRSVFLPQKTLERMHREAQQDLARIQQLGEEEEEEEELDGKKTPFISDNDLLTGWIARIITSSLPQARPLTFWHITNTRFRLPSLRNAPGVYIQNMLMGTFFSLSADLATRSLGRIALENRRALMPQLSEAQTVATLRYLRPSRDTSTFVCGDMHSMPVMITNWTKADLYEACDFGPAVVRAGQTGPWRAKAPGTMVSHMGQSLQKAEGGLCLIGIGGKDRDNNYWMGMSLYPQMWDKVEKEIDRLSM